MSRRAAGPINDSSNARKKARVSLSIAGSSCTVAPPLSSPALVPVSSNFATPRLESSVDTEVIEASSDFTPEIVATQIQQLSQLLQQQQQQQQQQQRDSEAEVDHTKKECSNTTVITLLVAEANLTWT
ncbi:hypothetical protein G6F46_009583 [Rhizopus delemar]|uniref:Uncharacterized protein n=2 Tax=Rhizopus TaxID=4842 RepID=A0A9P6YWN1_9FUNG|nr:hypothetical protein G6F55_008559 [Rhizopus delemar]KAG1546870.1 hypothetical protein G6F51_004612 [Rhizopus arrhizus]KAG1492758.1 hypothetical protein G6F54_009068 [Rhizopus delemar]KAG1522144.1 hypothetical protein G6F52_006114 [Rhizopus delemar]KAG1566066.1 hypothetical protein G6F50_009484 [Rhizopus delemar]